MSNITIISHENCNDGLLASYCCNQALKESKKVDEIYNFFMGHNKKSLEDIKSNEKLIEKIKNSDGLYILDFSFDKEVLKFFYEINPNLKLTIIDHHITAKNEFEDLMNSNDKKFDLLKEKLNNKDFKFEFNNDYSGAVLSYVYFILKKSPSLYKGEQDHLIPKFYKYIQDRDIWKWQFEKQSKPFTTTFMNKVKTLQDCETFFPVFNGFEITIHAAKNEEKFIEEGELVLDFWNNQVDKAMENARKIEVNINNKTVKGYIVNANSTLTSDLGSKLSRLNPNEEVFCLVWSEKEDGNVKVGVRSHDSFDSSIISKHFNGGGHKQASAFEINFEDFIKLRKELLENNFKISNKNSKKLKI